MGGAGVRPALLLLIGDVHDGGFFRRDWRQAIPPLVPNLSLTSTRVDFKISVSVLLYDRFFNDLIVPCITASKPIAYARQFRGHTRNAHIDSFHARR